MSKLSDKLDALARLEAEATPGPWEWTETGGSFALVMGPDGDELVRVRMNLGLGSNPDRDAAFVAAARNVLPELLAVARAAERITPAAPAERSAFARLRDALANLEAKL